MWASTGGVGLSRAAAVILPLRSARGEKLGDLLLFSPPATLDQPRVASVISLQLSSWVEEEETERERHLRNNRLAAALSNVELAAALVDERDPPPPEVAQQARFALALARDALIAISGEERRRGSNERS